MKYANYDKYDIGFIGSIAYYFSSILKEVAEYRKLKISFILKKPIDALIVYHSE